MLFVLLSLVLGLLAYFGYAEQDKLAKDNAELKGTLNREKIDSYVSNSLMLVTALSPVIGYQNAAHIAEQAAADGSTLREAALRSGKVSAEEYDKVIVPKEMIGEGVRGA